MQGSIASISAFACGRLICVLVQVRFVGNRRWVETSSRNRLDMQQSIVGVMSHVPRVSRDSPRPSP